MRSKLYPLRYYFAVLLFVGAVAAFTVWARQTKLPNEPARPGTPTAVSGLSNPQNNNRPTKTASPQAGGETATKTPAPVLTPGTSVTPSTSAAQNGNLPETPQTGDRLVPPDCDQAVLDAACTQEVFTGSYYVAEDGSDTSGDGSQANPWGTISKALEQVPDGALVLVKPGTYDGQIDFQRQADKGITLRSLTPYTARLRNNGPVLQVFFGRGLTVEGFDIAHDGPGADRYVIQIQDPEGNHEYGRNVILRNNVIHDSYNNDLIKVNNNASYVLIEGNIFYNMGGPETDSHLDINSVDHVVVQDNIFFNDYEGSKRINNNISGHFIVVKDSNGAGDDHFGSRQISIRRNIFLNWQGNPGNAFIGLGDGTNVSYFQAQDITIENNLMLGNSTNKIHAVLKVISARDVFFRNNTIVGDLPANAYFMRADIANPSFANSGFEIYNNIWSDETGTMGDDGTSTDEDFSITPGNASLSFKLLNNLYWNGDRPVPDDPDDRVRFTADANAYLLDPLLPAIPTDILLPRLDPSSGLIGGRFKSVHQAFVYLVKMYGTPAADSPVIDRALAKYTPGDDILGNPRQVGDAPDLGAVEIQN